MIILGLMGGFVWFSYVHPAQANALKLQQTVEVIRDHLKGSDAFSFATKSGVASGLKNRAEQAVQVMKNRRELPQQFVGDKLLDALSSITGGAVILGNRRNQVWRGALTGTDSPLRDDFERIEWARKHADVRACADLKTAGVSSAPSHGDFLAYCIARVMGEAQRCFQIGSNTSPDLHSLCAQEFALAS